MTLFTEQLKHKARDLGFVLSGVTAAASPGRISEFHAWLDAGYAGQMHYFEARRDAYSDVNLVLEGCRTIVMLAFPYDGSLADPPTSPEALQEPVGKIARYARGGEDYHDVIHLRLKQLKAWIEHQHPQAQVRGVVDTAPLLEREFAESAGLGWVGKNTLLLNRQWGSYFFLAALLTDLPLTVDEPSVQGYCGNCRACLDHCPTNAFPQPYVLDANRCISYLTIEHRGNIDDELKEKMSGWMFGCDVCQEVCPWNRKDWHHGDRPVDVVFQPITSTRSLIEVLQLSEDEFRSVFRKTPLWRPRRRGILRNAALLAGNSQALHHDVEGFRKTCDALERLLSDPEPILRSAAAWALSKLQPEGWGERLSQAIEVESDSTTKQQIRGLLPQSSRDS